MSLLMVQQPGYRVAVRNGAIAVLHRDQVVATRPAHEVTEVLLFGSATITDDARDLLWRQGVDIVFLSAAGTFRARYQSRPTTAGRRRVGQYAMSLDTERRAAFVAGLLAGKLRNQAYVLRRAAGSDQARALANARSIRALWPRLESERDVEVLRGLEGLAGRLYFEGFAGCIRNARFTFDGRNRRPPRDPINACLSFGYTMLERRVEQAVLAAGLDPYVGFLHDADRGASSLTLDLMEEFRPVVVDRLVLRLINRQQLSPDDFRGVDLAPTADAQAVDAAVASGDPVPMEFRGVHLADEGRALFIREFNLQWRTPYLYAATGRYLELGDVLRQQAFQIARVVEGASPRYQAFVLHDRPAAVGGSAVEE
jgi:CRISPR-associated protein Cas1